MTDNLLFFDFISNSRYLGTADPNNPWSVFNYSIEVKSNGQVGYAKYNKQPQQEFLLEFQDKFKVNAARKSKVDDNTAKMQSIKWLGV